MDLRLFDDTWAHWHVHTIRDNRCLNCYDDMEHIVRAIRDGDFIYRGFHADDIFAVDAGRELCSTDCQWREKLQAWHLNLPEAT